MVESDGGGKKEEKMTRSFFKKILPPVLKASLKGLLHHMRQTFVEDCFHKNRDKKVLLSYIIDPFISSGTSSHTNFQECFGIAEAFDRLGYSVDVINYDSSHLPDYSKYSCIFGFGDPFCASFYSHIPDLIRIHYATGAHVQVQNTETLKRAIDIYKERGKWLLNSCRVVKQVWSEQTMLSDAIVVLGNNWPRNTYATYYNGDIYSLNATYNAALAQFDFDSKDFSRAKKHYLWFGSAGAIHKGLDLLLDVFSQHADKTLHVAGLRSSEEDFLTCFHKELSLQNVIMHGFVDVTSQQYSDIIAKCGFVVVPSCSEACCTSLINCMCNGLIPVFTRQCGVDLKDYALEITALTQAAVSDAIERCDSLDDASLKQRSDACRADIMGAYSYDVFKKNMDAILRKILN